MESSSQLPRFGYRRTALWLDVSLCRVRRLWKRLGAAVFKETTAAQALRLGHPVATHPNNVWCYHFVHDRFADGRAFRLLCVLIEHTRECLAIEVARSITGQDVIHVLSRLMRLCGIPAFIRSAQATEFIAGTVMRWLRDQRVGLAFIPPGQTRHNGSV
jgi:putative transposase